MRHISKLRLLLSSATAPTVVLILLVLMMGYALLGGSGMIAWGDYSRQLRDAQAELKVVQTERARLANRVELLDPRRADPDMVEELIRTKLNVVNDDEVIVPLR